MLVKICGIRRIEDIEYVNILKPDYIGFVFAESKRKITILESITLKERLNNDIKIVGVFRNNDINFVKKIIDLDIIDIIQLHGNESDEYIKELKSYTKKEIILAYRDSKYVDYILYDNINPGSGNTFDWNIIKRDKKFILAGGININNLDEAIKINPYIIDVSTGVEENGYKDFDKMKEFIRRCRDYE